MTGKSSMLQRSLVIVVVILGCIGTWLVLVRPFSLSSEQDESVRFGDPPIRDRGALRDDWVEVDVRVRVTDGDGVLTDAEEGMLRVRVVDPVSMDRNRTDALRHRSDTELELTELAYIQPPGAAFQYDTDFALWFEDGVARLTAQSPGHLEPILGRCLGKRMRVIAPREPVPLVAGETIIVDLQSLE